jgi:hypothetical protein
MSLSGHDTDKFVRPTAATDVGRVVTRGRCEYLVPEAGSSPS